MAPIARMVETKSSTPGRAAPIACGHRRGVVLAEPHGGDVGELGAQTRRRRCRAAPARTPSPRAPRRRPCRLDRRRLGSVGCVRSVGEVGDGEHGGLEVQVASDWRAAGGGRRDVGHGRRPPRPWSARRSSSAAVSRCASACLGGRRPRRRPAPRHRGVARRVARLGAAAPLVVSRGGAVSVRGCHCGRLLACRVPRPCPGARDLWARPRRRLVGVRGDGGVRRDGRLDRRRLVAERRRGSVGRSVATRLSLGARQPLARLGDLVRVRGGQRSASGATSAASATPASRLVCPRRLGRRGGRRVAALRSSTRAPRRRRARSTRAPGSWRRLRSAAIDVAGQRLAGGVHGDQLAGREQRHAGVGGVDHQAAGATRGAHLGDDVVGVQPAAGQAGAQPRRAPQHRQRGQQPRVVDAVGGQRPLERVHQRVRRLVAERAAGGVHPHRVGDAPARR